jgi:hypothetical protein
MSAVEHMDRRGAIKPPLVLISGALVGVGDA